MPESVHHIIFTVVELINMEEQKPAIRTRELTPEEKQLEKLLFFQAARAQKAEEASRELMAIDPRPLPNYIPKPEQRVYGAD